ncbi:MAG: glycosyltransferase family 25 protein [Flavobacteriales bacterium]|nr:glycosyltransferase family 25 protein [Flavobacteriales bacterium]
MSAFPIYIINLKRESRRRAFMEKQLASLGIEAIFVDAIDSRTFTGETITHLADAGALAKHPQWLNDGAVACACSHGKAYNMFLETGAPLALFLEDDVHLPKNLSEVLDGIVSYRFPERHVVLLHFLAFKTAKFSRATGRNFGTFTAYAPTDLSAPTTAAAYVLDRAAAKSLSTYNYPVCIPADAWGHFIENEALEGMHCAVPPICSTEEFKSSIDYLPPATIAGRFSNTIERYKIPLLYSILKQRRKRMAEKGRGNFEMVE